MTDLQNEKAFQKQDGVFLSSRKVMAKKATSGLRFYKKVGLGKCSGTSFVAGWLEEELARLRDIIRRRSLSFFLDHTSHHLLVLAASRLQDPVDRHRGILHRQEVPIHQQCCYPWQNLQVSVKTFLLARVFEVLLFPRYLLIIIH